MMSSIRTLVLDDNNNMRSLLRVILNGLGIRDIHDAADSSDAFEILRNTPIDLAFVDYRLQDLDGAEFTKLLRTADDSPKPYLPIIMVSAHAERSRIKAAIDAGVDEFLAKPIRARDVATRIQAVVHRRRAFVRTSTYFGPDRRRRDLPNYTGPKRRATDLADADIDDTFQLD